VRRAGIEPAVGFHPAAPPSAPQTSGRRIFQSDYRIKTHPLPPSPQFRRLERFDNGLRTDWLQFRAILTRSVSEEGPAHDPLSTVIKPDLAHFTLRRSFPDREYILAIAGIMQAGMITVTAGWTTLEVGVLQELCGDRLARPLCSIPDREQ